VDEFQQLVSERGQRFEAALAPGRRPVLAPRGGRLSVGGATGGDGEYVVVCKATGDCARRSDTEEAVGPCHRQGGG
jgi:hypothetical protein